MQLYDLLVDGYHTPLTAAQIAERFHAGRLLRNDPCKEVGKTAWRTLDELFPLLKYDSSIDLTAPNIGGARPHRSTTNSTEITRRAVLIGVLVALFVLSTFLVGPSYFSLGGQPGTASVRTRAVAHSPMNPHSQSATSTPDSSVAHPPEVTRLLQEDQARHLQETKLAEQQIIEERLRAQQQQTQSRHAAEHEFSVPLGTYTSVSLGGYQYRIAIHDDGPDEIRVIVNGRPAVRLQKRNGFEGRDIETPILANGTAHLYYVNTISDHVGHCTLHLRDE